jgi:hypothetical protein
MTEARNIIWIDYSGCGDGELMMIWRDDAQSRQTTFTAGKKRREEDQQKEIFFIRLILAWPEGMLNACPPQKLYFREPMAVMTE